tara:strand:- start:516 stop:719 length:204 start_codon:yes stop_codon:yes gene_type:complete
MDSFLWRGELIKDIKTWADARGEMLIPYRRTRQVPGLLGALLTETGEMPESFWNHLTMTDGWFYEKR